MECLRQGIVSIKKPNPKGKKRHFNLQTVREAPANKFSQHKGAITCIIFMNNVPECHKSDNHQEMRK